MGAGIMTGPATPGLVADVVLAVFFRGISA